MRPKRLQRGVARLGDRCGVGHVAGDGRDVVAERLGGLLASAMSRSQIATLAPGLEEALGDRLAEALGAARDDGDAALQIDVVRHVSLLRRCVDLALSASLSQFATAESQANVRLDAAQLCSACSCESVFKIAAS